MRVALTLSPTPDSAREARRFLMRHTPADWEPFADIAVLLLTELVTNVILHARTPFSVAVVTDNPDRLRIEVADGSYALVQRRQFDVLAACGRGLRIVDATSSKWGVDGTPEGKTVWAEIDRSDAPRLLGDVFKASVMDDA